MPTDTGGLATPRAGRDAAARRCRCPRL